MKQYHFRRMLTVLKWPGSDTHAALDSASDAEDDEDEDLVPTQGTQYFTFFFFVYKYIYIYFLNMCLRNTYVLCFLRKTCI